MYRQRIKSIVKNLTNIPGWKTRRKIVVIESDDWGSIRMPSLKSFKMLEKNGLDLKSADAERYNLNDTLASNIDLEGLFDVLSNVKDKHGKDAVFTAVSVVANPDFQKIKESDFHDYFYEPVTATLKRYPGCDKSFDLWKEGKAKSLFVPQFHGREHLNVKAWMNDLRLGDKQTMLAFSEQLWGFVPKSYPRIDYQAAFKLSDPGELDFHREVIIDGLMLFEQILDYKAEFFVPPNGLLNNSLNQILVDGGIKYRYASKIQNEPRGFGRYRNRFHYQGQKGQNGVRYIIRNCFFEPSQKGKDWVDNCLSDIHLSFRLQKPAIIGTHRVNYIGSLNPSNRDLGLNQLQILLKEIKKHWPQVEFMTTTQLGELMNN